MTINAIAVPTARILGESAVHVERQSLLNLTCVASKDVEGGHRRDGSNAIDWYKDGQVSEGQNVHVIR